MTGYKNITVLCICHCKCTSADWIDIFTQVLHINHRCMFVTKYSFVNGFCCQYKIVLLAALFNTFYKLKKIQKQNKELLLKALFGLGTMSQAL